MNMNRITLASHGANQLLLILIPFTITTGFADLSSITLCLTHVLPFELAVGLGSGVMFMLVLGQSVSSTDLYIAWRARKKKAVVGTVIEKISGGRV